MTTKKASQPYAIFETIMGTPEKLEAWLSDTSSATVKMIAEEVRKRKPRRIYIAGTGSSYMAAMAQAYGFEDIADIPSAAYITSELRTYTPKEFSERDILFINTHSGKSPGDAEMAQAARNRGVFTIGVTDIEGTAFAKELDLLFIGEDGPKKEMPATRTYCSSIFRMLLLAVECAKKQGSVVRARECERQIVRIPKIMRKFLDEFETKAPEIVDSLVESSAYFIISAGPNMATAIEGAMGLTQGTGMPAAGYNLDEYMHGPIQSLGPGRCVMTVAPPGPSHEKIWRFADVAKHIGAKVVMIAPEGSEAIGHGDVKVEMPSGMSEILTPPLYCAPFWLIGYHFSLKNGFNPDTLSMERDAFKKSGLAEMKKYI